MNFEPQSISNILYSMETFRLREKFSKVEMERFVFILVEALNKAVKETKSSEPSKLKPIILEELKAASRYFMMFDMQNFFPVDEFLAQIVKS